MRDNRLVRSSDRHKLLLQTVHFDVALIADNKAPLGIEHGEALRHVVQRRVALGLGPQLLLLSLDAIGRTLVRVLVTRRKLLEWRTASDAQQSARTDLSGFYSSMWVLPAVALAAAMVVVTARSNTWTLVGFQPFGQADG